MMEYKFIYLKGNQKYINTKSLEKVKKIFIALKKNIFLQKIKLPKEPNFNFLPFLQPGIENGELDLSLIALEHLIWEYSEAVKNLHKIDSPAFFAFNGIFFNYALNREPGVTQQIF
jgi:hypothetical protein